MVDVVVRAEPNGEAITLSKKQAVWFAKDLAGPRFRSRISEFKAAPIARFEYDGKQYLMHGNAVIHVSDAGEEELWTGPHLQSLVRELMREHGPRGLAAALERLEAREHLDDVEMDAPGAYPGGGPAPLRP